jgi:CRP-like cAMP-binding protein
MLMPLSNLRKRLHAFPLLNALSADELDRLFPHIEIWNAEPHTRLFRQGQAAAHFFLVMEGRIKECVYDTTNHEEEVIGLYKDGDVIAQELLGMDQPIYSSDGLALNRVQLVAVEIEAFLSLVHDTHPVVRDLLARMSQQLMHDRVRNHELRSYSARQRVVRYLLKTLREQAASAPAPIRLRLQGNRDEISAYLSMRVETFSRALGELRKDGLIQVSGKHVTIRNPAGLQMTI